MKQREINLRQLLKCNKEAFDSLHFHSTHHSAIGNRLALIEHDLPISNQQQKTEKNKYCKKRKFNNQCDLDMPLHHEESRLVKNGILNKKI